MAFYEIADILPLRVAGARGKNPETGRDVREVRYRLKDNYTRFYLKYIPLKKGMSVRTVLVYDGELAPELEEDGFFDHLVGMDELFRQS